MVTMTFDTLKFARRLKEAGVPEQQAEAEAEVLAEALEANLNDLVTRSDLILGPSRETAPVRLGVPPDPLDQVQFRAIRRQVQQHQPVVDQPILPLFWVDRVMHRGVVQYHQSQGLPIFPPGDPVDPIDPIPAPDGRVLHVMPKRAGGIMGVAPGGPGPLHVRKVGEAALVQIKQPDPALARGRLAALQGGAGRLEPLGAPLFFSDRRVRFHDSPRAFRPAASRSRRKSAASGWASFTRRAISRKAHGSARATASAVSNIVAVSLAGRPPLCPFSSPTRPRVCQPFSQLYTVWGVTPRMSDTTFGPWPLLNASTPSARGRKSRTGVVARQFFQGETFGFGQFDSRVHRLQDFGRSQHASLHHIHQIGFANTLNAAETPISHCSTLLRPESSRPASAFLFKSRLL